MTDARRLLLLDTASLYYRAFFGLPSSLTAPDGTVVNALRGMTDFAARLIDDHAPAVTVACWDADWRPAWRVALIESYKAHRLAAADDVEVAGEETPDDLAPQVPLIARMLELAGIPVVGVADHEADDVIATYAHTWDGPVDIVTGDRDLLQLVDDAAERRVLYTARGVTKLETFDEAAVQAKYGVPASAYVDFAVLRGDPSDGLPGVAGIGEKTAMRLVNDFGDLDAILAAAEDASTSITPRVRGSLQDSRDCVGRAQTVVTTRNDLDVPEATRRAPARDELLAFAETWGFTSPAERLLAVLDA